MKPYEKLQRYWRETNSEIGTVETSQPQVEALEARYSLRLPKDFKDYLLHSSPKDEMAGLDWPTSWWHFDRLRNIPEEYEHEIGNEIVAHDAAKCIFFADYAIWCSAWAICCVEGENRGKVAVIGGNPDRFVADNFAHFVEMYIEGKGASRKLF